jgi:hypothetical protein
MRRAASCAALAATILVAGPADAYRPFDGTDADVADLGEFELELGPTHLYATPDAKYLIAPATVLNLGFAPGFELVVDGRNFVALQPVEGQPRARLLDTDVFVKTLLRRGALQGESGVSVATELGPLLPEAGGDHGFGASVNVITSYRWPALTLHVNVNPMLSRTHHFDAFGSVIVEGPFSWTVRPVGEVFVQHEITVSTAVSALLGAIWAAHENFAVDAAVRAAHEQGTRVLEVRLGFTWAVAVWEPQTAAIHD